jgi:hypothetical protein
MSDKRIHIISFDVPFPANYGGVIDVFYKLKALSEAGYSIVLHCFEYGKGRQEELNRYCKEVFYYKRNLSKKQLLSSLPFVVSSRISKPLVERLCLDNAPILFEGLHTCFCLDYPELKGRLKLVRCHNVEHDYYLGLAEAEPNRLKRIYFKLEAKKLKRFEAILKNADGLLAISGGDEMYFQNKYGKTHLISTFPPFRKVDILEGLGKFALYHGNLGVAENNRAVIYLLENVFSKIEYPLIITGSNPRIELQKWVAKLPWVEIRANLTDDETFELIKIAQMSVLPTFQATGIKLKLLNSLFIGRHCLVNTPMVKETGLEELCEVCDSPEAFLKTIQEFKNISFGSSQIAERAELLESKFSSNASLARLLPLLS